RFFINGAFFQALSVAFDRRLMDSQKQTSVAIVSLDLSRVASRVNAPSKARKAPNLDFSARFFVTPEGLPRQDRLMFHTISANGFVKIRLSYCKFMNFSCKYFVHFVPIRYFQPCVPRA